MIVIANFLLAFVREKNFDTGGDIREKILEKDHFYHFRATVNGKLFSALLHA